MSSRRNRNRPELRAEELILDTGPLFDFLLLRFSEETGRVGLENDLNYLKTDLDAQRFRGFVTGHQIVLTTPGVVAEIQRHQRRHLPGDQGRFWRLARGQFHELRIDEEAVRLGEMEEGDLSNQGPVDASLLQLARRRLGQYRRVAVLTADRPLWERCRNQQILACWIHEILAGP